ncbi:MAG: hypothetical protein ABJC62_02305 [Frankiaceae bacterium]
MPRPRGGTRARYPQLGRLVLALTREPPSTRVWAQGARGERAVAAELDALSPGYVEVLHDRRLRTPEGRLAPSNRFARRSSTLGMCFIR